MQDRSRTVGNFGMLIQSELLQFKVPMNSLATGCCLSTQGRTLPFKNIEPTRTVIDGTALVVARWKDVSLSDQLCKEPPPRDFQSG